MTLQLQNTTPKERFPLPELEADPSVMTPADYKLPPKQVKAKRLALQEALEHLVPGRPVVVMGVSSKIAVADGTEQGAMHPGRAYQMPREDFVKLRLDPDRGHKVLLLEPRVPCMYFEVSRALNIMFPHKARNTFLANA